MRGRTDIQPAAQDRGARELRHLLQQPAARVHLLPGVAIGALAGVAAVYLVIRRVFFGVLLPGWPSLIVSVWLLGGLILACLGIIGIYLSKIFIETKQRPYTIVRSVHERTADPAESARSCETVDRYYSEKLRQFGATPRGVDWSTAASQELRFSRSCRSSMSRRRASLIDYGCGYGALLDYLGATGVASRTTGSTSARRWSRRRGAARRRRARLVHRRRVATRASRLRRGERHLQRQARTRAGGLVGLRVSNAGGHAVALPPWIRVQHADDLLRSGQAQRRSLLRRSAAESSTPAGSGSRRASRCFTTIRSTNSPILVRA